MADLGSFSIGVELLFDQAQIKQNMDRLEQQLKGKMQVNLDTTQAQQGVKDLTNTQIEADRARVASARAVAAESAANTAKLREQAAITRAAAAEEAQRLRDHRATMQLNIRLQAEASKAERDRSKATIDGLENEMRASRNLWQARERSDEQAYADQSRIKQKALEMAAALDQQSDAYRRLTQVAAAAQRTMDQSQGYNTPGGFSSGVTQGVLNALGGLGVTGQILEQIISTGMRLAEAKAEKGAQEVAKEAGEGLREGLKAQTAGIGRAAGDLGEAVEDGAKKALDIRSPSRVMRTVGENAAEGLAVGILAKSNTARIAGQQLAAAVRDGVGDLNLNIGSDFELAPGAGMGMFSQAIPESIGEAMGEVTEQIAEAVEAMGDLPQAAAGAADAADDLGDAAEGMGDAVSGAAEHTRALADAHKEQDESARAAAIGEAKTAIAVAATTAAVAALSVMLVQGVQKAAHYEQQMAELSLVTDKTSSEMDSLGRAMLKMSVETVTSFDELKDGMAQLQGASLKGVEDDAVALETLAVSAKLAKVTLSDVNTSADALSSVLNAYSLSAADAGKVSDLLWQAIKSGKAELSDIAGNLGAVASQAHSLNVPLEELLGAMALLTTKGIPASTALDYIRSALTNVQKPSKEAADQAKELGIAFDAVSLKRLGLIGFLEQLGKGVGDNSEAMATLLGDVGGLNAVLGLLSDGMGDTKNIMDQMGQSTGSLDRDVDKLKGTAQNSAKEFGLAWDRVQILFATGLLPTFTKFLNDAVLPVLNALGDIKTKLAEVSDSPAEIKKTLTIDWANDSGTQMALKFFLGAGQQISDVRTSIASKYSDQDLRRKLIEAGVMKQPGMFDKDLEFRQLEMIHNDRKAWEDKLTEALNKNAQAADRLSKSLGNSGAAGVPQTFTASKASSIARAAGILNINPNDLAAVISFETGGSFNPNARNPSSSATGLIQFMKAEYGDKYGMSRDQFGNLSFEQQMEYVIKYLQARGIGKPGKTSLASIYEAVAGSGYKRGSSAYDLNPTWDANGNGVIEPFEQTKSTAFQSHVRPYYGGASMGGNKATGYYETVAPGEFDPKIWIRNAIDPSQWSQEFISSLTKAFVGDPRVDSDCAIIAADVMGTLGVKLKGAANERIDAGKLAKQVVASGATKVNSRELKPGDYVDFSGPNFGATSGHHAGIFVGYDANGNLLILNNHGGNKGPSNPNGKDVPTTVDAYSERDLARLRSNGNAVNFYRPKESPYSKTSPYQVDIRSNKDRYPAPAAAADAAKPEKSFGQYIKEAERILGQVNKYAANGTAPNADKWRLATKALKDFTDKNDLAAQAVQWVQSKAKEAGKEVSKYGQTFDRLSRQMDIAGNAEKLGTNVVPQLKAIQAEAEKAAAAELKRNGQSEKYVKLQGIAADAAAKLKTIQGRKPEETGLQREQRILAERNAMDALEKSIRGASKARLQDIVAGGVQKEGDLARVEAAKKELERRRQAALRPTDLQKDQAAQREIVTQQALEKAIRGASDARLKQILADGVKKEGDLARWKAADAELKRREQLGKQAAQTQRQNQQELNEAVARRDEAAARNRLQRLKDQQAQELQLAGDDAKKKAEIITRSGPIILAAEAKVNALVRSKAVAAAQTKADEDKKKPGANLAVIEATRKTTAQAAYAAEAEANQRARTEQARTEAAANKQASDAQIQRDKQRAAALTTIEKGVQQGKVDAFKNALDDLKRLQAEQLADEGKTAAARERIVKASGPAILKASYALNAALRAQQDADVDTWAKSEEAKALTAKERDAEAARRKAANRAEEKRLNIAAQNDQNRALSDAGKRRAQEEKQLAQETAALRVDAARATAQRLKTLEDAELATFKGTAEQKLALVKKYALAQYNRDLNIAEAVRQGAYNAAKGKPNEAALRGKADADYAATQAQLQVTQAASVRTAVEGTQREKQAVQDLIEKYNEARAALNKKAEAGTLTADDMSAYAKQLAGYWAEAGRAGLKAVPAIQQAHAAAKAFGQAADGIAQRARIGVIDRENDASQAAGKYYEAAILGVEELSKQLEAGTVTTDAYKEGVGGMIGSLQALADAGDDTAKAVIDALRTMADGALDTAQRLKTIQDENDRILTMGAYYAPAVTKAEELVAGFEAGTVSANGLQTGMEALITDLQVFADAGDEVAAGLIDQFKQAIARTREFQQSVDELQAKLDLGAFIAPQIEAAEQLFAGFDAGTVSAAQFEAGLTDIIAKLQVFADAGDETAQSVITFLQGGIDKAHEFKQTMADIDATLGRGELMAPQIEAAEKLFADFDAGTIKTEALESGLRAIIDNLRVFADAGDEAAQGVIAFLEAGITRAREFRDGLNEVQATLDRGALMAPGIEKAQQLSDDFDAGKIGLDALKEGLQGVVDNLQVFADAGDETAKAVIEAIQSIIAKAQELYDTPLTLAPDPDDTRLEDWNRKLTDLQENYEAGAITAESFRQQAVEMLPQLELLAKAAEAQGKTDLAQIYRDAAAGLRVLGGAALKTAENLSELEKLGVGLRELFSGTGSVFKAFGADSLASVADNAADAVGNLAKMPAAINEVKQSWQDFMQQKSFANLGGLLGSVGGVLGIVGSIAQGFVNIGNIIEANNSKLNEWKKELREVASLEKEAMGSKKYGGIQNPYYDELQQDAANREKLADSKWYQRLGWALFGGAPQVMEAGAAKLKASAAAIFNDLAGALSNSLTDALMKAWGTGQWEDVSKAFEKSINEFVARQAITAIMAQSNLQQLIKDYADARAKAMEDGVITPDEQQALDAQIANLRAEIARLKGEAQGVLPGLPGYGEEDPEAKARKENDLAQQRLSNQQAGLKLQYTQGLISKKEFDAQMLASEHERLRLEMEAALAQEGLTEEQKAVIREKYRLLNAQLDADAARAAAELARRLAADVAETRSKADEAAWRRGDMDWQEYQARQLQATLDRIERERQEALASAELTAEQIAAINAKFDQQRADALSQTRDGLLNDWAGAAGNGLMTALETGDFQKFGSDLESSIFKSTVAGLVSGLASDVVRTALKPLADDVAAALRTATTADDIAAIGALKDGLANVMPQFRAIGDALSPLFRDFGHSGGEVAGQAFADEFQANLTGNLDALLGGGSLQTRISSQMRGFFSGVVDKSLTARLEAEFGKQLELAQTGMVSPEDAMRQIAARVPEVSLRLQADFQPLADAINRQFPDLKDSVDGLKDSIDGVQFEQTTVVNYGRPDAPGGNLPAALAML